jgi:hypothetical protein
MDGEPDRSVAVGEEPEGFSWVSGLQGVGERNEVELGILPEER